MNLRSYIAAPFCFALLGCGAIDGNMHTYWGPDGTVEGLTTLTQGAELSVQGLVTRTLIDSGGPLEFLEVVLVESETPVNCSMYTAWMEQVAALQDFVIEVFEQPEEDRPAAWEDYLCQELSGSSRDIFGGDGSYRALHALLNTTGGGPDGDLFRPASPGDTVNFLGGNLVASQRDRYVGRLYERSKHAAGILPESANNSFEATDISPIEGCLGVVAGLVQDLESGRDAYPDRNSLALQAATHRWYHHADDRTTVRLNEGGDLAVGITFPDWKQAATTDGLLTATVFQSVARAPEEFPYEYVLLTTKGRQVDMAACTALSTFAPLVWPEVVQFEAEPIAAGDDDDSAQP